jgi:thymidylate kinase
MAWVILEGLDRTGKSTVAEHYKRQGYKVVHMSAPDKKYNQPGYVGPSYLDSLIEIYTANDGLDVVFDRSPYGEFVWPTVYNRAAQLDEEGLEILSEYEQQNSAQKFVMFDANTEAHWQRCVDNKEPLNRSQFNTASLMFNKLAKQHGFQKKQLSDFAGLANEVSKEAKVEQPLRDVSNSSDDTVADHSDLSVSEEQKTPEQLKLEKANAINQILSGRIIKKRGEPYDSLDKELRTYLNRQLGAIFGGSPIEDFSPDEVQILKLMAQRLKSKQGA